MGPGGAGWSGHLTDQAAWVTAVTAGTAVPAGPAGLGATPVPAGPAGTAGAAGFAATACGSSVGAGIRRVPFRSASIRALVGGGRWGGVCRGGLGAGRPCS